MKNILVKRFCRVLVFLLLAVALTWWILPGNIFAIDSWKELEQMVDRVQQDLPYISSTELFETLSSPGKEKPLLIDVRESEEFEVSHLKDAVNLKNAKQIVSLLQQPENRNRQVVLYCSVGYRSAIIGNEVKKEVPNQVFNLKGSIFQWANEGKPVYKNLLPVNEVHPYSRSWGKFLRTDMWPKNFK